MSTETTVAHADPIDHILADAEAYEPTPQEIRWGLIEHQARKLARELSTTPMAVVMPADARIALDDLKDALTNPASLVA